MDHIGDESELPRCYSDTDMLMWYTSLIASEVGRQEPMTRVGLNPTSPFTAGGELGGIINVRHHGCISTRKGVDRIARHNPV